MEAILADPFTVEDKIETTDRRTMDLALRLELHEHQDFLHKRSARLVALGLGLPCAIIAKAATISRNDLANILSDLVNATIRFDGETVRILNIDKPEIGEAGCDAEGAAGIVAKRRLEGLLSSGRMTLKRGE